MLKTKTLRNLITFLSILILSTKAYSQVSASFYMNDSNSKFAIGYNFNEKLWSDLRIYSNRRIDHIVPELVLNYNFIPKNNYDVYAGGGIIVSNSVNGIVVPIGIAVKPIENLKNLSLNIEFTPLYEIDDRDLYLRGFLGIRFKLK